MQTNLDRLSNLMQPLMKFNTSLRQVNLLQGTKAYGAHIAPMKVPGLERHPRHPHENFYWLQEDYLKEIQQVHSWSYTIWRPQIIFGHARHAPMNMLAAIGVYAALQKDKGLPLSYPGGPSGVMEAIDANLLASAIIFSMDNPHFVNETFNVTNGDVFTWQNVWSAIARSFEMDIDEPRQMRLSDSLYGEQANRDWGRLVQQHAFRPVALKTWLETHFIMQMLCSTPEGAWHHRQQFLVLLNSGKPVWRSVSIPRRCWFNGLPV